MSFNSKERHCTHNSQSHVRINQEKVVEATWFFEFVFKLLVLHSLAAFIAAFVVMLTFFNSKRWQ